MFTHVIHCLKSKFTNLVLGLVVAVMQLASRCWADNDVFPTDFAGADVNIGERLFLETRFSQYFFTNSGGNANADIPGDAVMALLQTMTNPVSGPFAGQAMNCRQCHLVDEKGYGDFGDHTLGNRTYADFARHSPVPLRADGRTQTTRNAQVLVDALLPHEGPQFLHYDGQFASVHDLIIDTLTGRNYGWKPEEQQTAIHHIASVIRNDDGMGYLATEERGGRFQMMVFGMASPGETAYYNVFSGFQEGGFFLFDPRSLTTQLISPPYWMNVDQASDQEILDTVAALIEAYLRNLVFAQATNGVDFFGAGTPIFNGSPFDVFLIKNDLPQLPAAGETPVQYSRRLLGLVEQLASPQFVTDPTDGHLETQEQPFVFGATELDGLKIFLRTKADRQANPLLNVGNCAACHAPPAFTDFIFHNTGASQEEYDAIHGAGNFQALFIPDLSARQTNHDAYLPPTPQHPQATGRFETPATLEQPDQTDLGLWNVFANPDFPAPQVGLSQITPQLLGLTTPQIENAQASQGHFIFTGSNGTPGSTCYVHSATNLSSVWAVVATNSFDGNGRFNAAFTMPADMPQQFFKLSLKLPTPAEMLPRTIALFKTSNVRDLGHSSPYLHTGRMDSLEQTIQFYKDIADQARSNHVRNGDPELNNIFLDDSAIAPLAAFLQSLNEDYTD